MSDWRTRAKPVSIPAMPDAAAMALPAYADPDGLANIQIEGFAQPQVVQGDWRSRAQPVQAQPVVDPITAAFNQKKGITDRIADDYVNRVNKAENITNLENSGQLGGTEATIYRGLNAAALPIDATGQLIKTVASPVGSAINWTADTFTPNLKGAIKDGYSAVANSPVGEMASNAVQGFQDYRQNHPVASARIGGAVDLGNIAAAFAPVGKGKSVAGSTLESVAAPIERGAGKAINAVNTRTVIPSAQEVRQYAGGLFKKADAEGGIIGAPEADGFYNQIAQLDKQTEAGTIFAGDSPVKQLMQRINDEKTGLRGKPLTFEAAKEVDEALGELAYGTMDIKGNLDSNGTKFLDMQRALRERVAQTEGGKTLTDAREAWSASIRMSDIERIIAKAGRSEQPATVIRNGAKTLLDQAKKTKGASKEEIKALEKMADTGIVTDFFRLGGSGLVPIISTIAGAPGGVVGSALAGAAGYGIQQGSKAIGVARQTGRANKALEASSNRLGLTKTVKRIDLQKAFEAKKLLKKGK